MASRAARIAQVTGVVVIAFVLLAAIQVRRRAQHPDDAFDVSVTHPVFTGTRPVVMFDEGHHNVPAGAGTRGTYDPFLRLIANDGFRVTRNHAAFSRATLATAQVLVIVNALGAPLFVLPGASKPAFTATECDVVRDWVRDGGSLLLVADHEPAGAAAKEMSRRFDVDMSTGRTFDFVHFDSSGGSPSWLVFSRTNGLLGDHAILRGRDSTEQVRRVVSYTGQSLQGPPNSVSLLRLDEKAFDILGPRRELSGAGRSQGIALELGRGRVVILGEAAMLTAQVTDNGRLRFGMNRPGSDDRQFALNVMRWLGRGL